MAIDKYSDHFRTDPASLPRPPTTFPRTQWLESVPSPPFHESHTATQVAWSGQQASWCWSRCKGNAAPQPNHLTAPAVPDVVDETCFKLAVFDKVFELMMHYKYQQSNMIPKHAFTWRLYVREVEGLMSTVYKWAVSELPPNSPPPPSLPRIAPFLRSALHSWSDISNISNRPSDRDLFAPRGVVPSPSTAPLKELCEEDFGRFASKYYTVRSIMFCTGANDEIVRRPYLWEGETLPSELEPVPRRL